MLRHGDIDQESAIKHLTERVATDPTMVAVVLDGISRCRNEVLMKRADYELILTLPPPPNGIRICNPMADHFVACLYSHTFRVSLARFKCLISKPYLNTINIRRIALYPIGPRRPHARQWKSTLIDVHFRSQSDPSERLANIIIWMSTIQ